VRESTAILGKGGDIAPFPRPLTLLEDARTLLRKRKLCPNNLCHLKGSPQYSKTALGLRKEAVDSFESALRVM